MFFLCLDVCFDLFFIINLFKVFRAWFRSRISSFRRFRVLLFRFCCVLCICVFLLVMFCFLLLIVCLCWDCLIVMLTSTFRRVIVSRRVVVFVCVCFDFFLCVCCCCR